MKKSELLNSTAAVTRPQVVHEECTIFSNRDVYMRLLLPGDALLPKGVVFAEQYICVFDSDGDMILCTDSVDRLEEFCDDNCFNIHKRH